MKVESELHMTAGDGETSYAKNSRIQEKAMVEMKPVLEKVTREVYTTLRPQGMVIVDLGCSSGPNTLRFVSEVIRIIARHCSELRQPPQDKVELQFFLNDLPANDFNSLFRYFEHFRKLTAHTHMGEALPPYYISGLPGSYYTRLFPRQTVHLFHSLFCLQWRSQAPKGLERAKKSLQDEGDIYMTATSSSQTVKLYQKQFQNDFSLFLKLRHEELVVGGQMVLTFIGRKIEDVHGGEPNLFYGLLAQSLRCLVDKGLVEKEKLDSFYIPIYSPSVREVEEMVAQNGSFDVDHIHLFQLNWDPYDDSEGGDVLHAADSVRSGINVASCLRAVMESVVASHFGHAIIDALFTEYARRVAKHLKKEKTKHAVIVLTLKKVR